MQLPLKHILLLVLGLNLMKNNVGIFAHYGCQCTGQTRVTNSGSIIGECLTRHNGRFWCYVSGPPFLCGDEQRTYRGSKFFASYLACQYPRVQPLSGCKCTSQTYLDQNTGSMAGNCRQRDSSGRFWCYVNLPAKCGDEQRGPCGLYYSHRACELQLASQWMPSIVKAKAFPRGFH